MRREIGPLRALANVILIAAVIALAGFGLSRVALRNWQTQETFPVRANFSHIGGIAGGNRVRMQGMDAGVVEAIVVPTEPGGPVTLVLRVDARLRPLIRADALARIGTEGVVGAKVVEIVPGKPDAPALADGAAIRSEAPIELADLMRDAQASLRRLDVAVNRVDQGMGEVQAIAAKVRNGEGTLGKLVQDDEAYREVMDLARRGRRSFAEMEENLLALKQTWPLKSYFERRAFYDVDRLLYRPGSERSAQVFRASDLFEPDSARLTPAGRRVLDGVVAWFRAKPRPKTTEVVIASFTDIGAQGDEVARILTQDQSDAVRRYLVDHGSITSVGWFGSRKVASVGYGTKSPIGVAVADGARPARRVEIILFSPQT